MYEVFQSYVEINETKQKDNLRLPQVFSTSTKIGVYFGMDTQDSFSAARFSKLFNNTN